MACPPRPSLLSIVYSSPWTGTVSPTSKTSARSPIGDDREPSSVSSAAMQAMLKTPTGFERRKSAARIEIERLLRQLPRVAAINEVDESSAVYPKRCWLWIYSTCWNRCWSQLLSFLVNTCYHWNLSPFPGRGVLAQKVLLGPGEFYNQVQCTHWVAIFSLNMDFFALFPKLNHQQKLVVARLVPKCLNCASETLRNKERWKWLIKVWWKWRERQYSQR